jgi:membrane-bound metal-dependent hydrolase YbcI (DUF457 family)
MMGKTHAITGAMAFGLAAIPATPLLDLRPGDLLLGTVVTAGAAVLPDIDHPGSGISRTLGPATRAFAWLVRRTSGGHRCGTHSLTGVAIVTLLAFTATGLYARNAWWLAAGAGLAVMLGGAGYLAAATEPPRPARPRRPVHPHTSAAAWTAGVALAALTAAAVCWPHQTGTFALAALLVLVLSAAARLFNARRMLGLRREWDDALPIPVTLALLLGGADLQVVPFAVLLGVIVHIAGDMATLGGCPLGWPWSRTMRGPRWFRTNSPVETGPITWGCVGVFAATAGWNTGVLGALIGVTQ